MGDVKDDRKNMIRASYNDKCRIKPELEQLLQRRCIYASLISGTERRSIIVVNTDTLHHENHPKPLELLGEDHVEYTPPTGQPTVALRPFDDCLVKINIRNLRSVQLLINSGTRMIDGICLIVATIEDGAVNVNAPDRKVNVFFVSPMMNENPFLDQYLLAGVFVADFDYLSKFLGHQGAFATYLCLIALLQIKQSRMVS